MSYYNKFENPIQLQFDWTDGSNAGRSLSFIEDFIRAEVLPLYSNTHTTTTVTSMQTTMFRHEARDVVRNAVNASEHDSVVFAGTGCTGAVHKLIDALGIRDHSCQMATGRFSDLMCLALRAYYGFPTLRCKI